MKKILSLVLALGVLTQTGQAQDEDAFVTFKVLKPEVALTMAQAAMESCREGGSQVTIAVVDRFGVLQVLLRDRYAGIHSIETATRKAATAVSFRTDTVTLDEVTRPGSVAAGIRLLSSALPLGGGVPVESAGSVVAGIGVSGAPDPLIDDECARDGIDAIQDILDF